MSQFDGGNRKMKVTGPSDVYTVLLLVAAVGLLAAVIYVAVKNMALSGSGNPFSVASAGWDLVRGGLLGA